MARDRLLAALIAVPVALLGAAPAAAQFGGIFDALRPPADVPNRPPARPQPPPQQQPAQQPQQQPPQTFGAPPPGGIRSEPLATPGGALPQQGALPRPPAGTAPGQTGQAPLSGLPPGQRQPRGTPQPANTNPQPGDEVITAAPSRKDPNPIAVFSGLDKITGRIITFEVNINETVQFGALQVTPRVCYTRPPSETPNTDAFIEVDEITLQSEVRRLFTGWMYAASPGLHGVEHSIYDVWLIDCKSAGSTAAAGTKPPTPGTQAPQQTAPQATPAPPRR